MKRHQNPKEQMIGKKYNTWKGNEQTQETKDEVVKLLRIRWLSNFSNSSSAVSQMSIKYYPSMSTCRILPFIHFCLHLRYNPEVLPLANPKMKEMILQKIQQAIQKKKNKENRRCFYHHAFCEKIFQRLCFNILNEINELLMFQFGTFIEDS